MLARRPLALALAAFFAAAGALHGHATALGSDDPACAACAMHLAGGDAPLAVALPPPAASEFVLTIDVAAPLCSRAVQYLRFETGPPAIA